MTRALLTPLLRAELKSTGELFSDDDLRREVTLPQPYEAWCCGVCNEPHEYKSDAETCCSESSDGEGVMCPVCATRSASLWSAVDCCLWKSLDAPARWRIATAVEAGATWADAIAGEAS